MKFNKKCWEVLPPDVHQNMEIIDLCCQTKYLEYFLRGLLKIKLIHRMTSYKASYLSNRTSIVIVWSAMVCILAFIANTGLPSSLKPTFVLISKSMLWRQYELGIIIKLYGHVFLCVIPKMLIPTYLKIVTYWYKVTSLPYCLELYYLLHQQYYISNTILTV